MDATISIPFPLLLLLLPLCCAERVYFLTGVGLHSVLPDGSGVANHAAWGLASDACGTMARGLSVDETTGWAVVTCGPGLYKANLFRASEDFTAAAVNAAGAPLYSVAVDTQSNTAYFSSFEGNTAPAWYIRGHYLPGCASLSEMDTCLAVATCRWRSSLCEDNTQYTLLTVNDVSEAIGGGLYADGANTIWMSYISTEGGKVVSRAASGGVKKYPGVETIFPAGEKEIGFPIVENVLYVLDQGAGATMLRGYSAGGEATLLHSAVPPFKGNVLHPDSPVRQPSIAVIETNKVFYVAGDSILQQQLPCTDAAPCPAPELVLTRPGMGPIFYREAPKVTDVPLPKETAAPVETVVPKTETDSSGGDDGFDLKLLLIIAAGCAAGCLLCGLLAGWAGRRKKEEIEEVKEKKVAMLLAAKATPEPFPPSPSSSPVDRDLIPQPHSFDSSELFEIGKSHSDPNIFPEQEVLYAPTPKSVSVVLDTGGSFYSITGDGFPLLSNGRGAGVASPVKRRSIVGSVSTLDSSHGLGQVEKEKLPVVAVIGGGVPPGAGPGAGGLFPSPRTHTVPKERFRSVAERAKVCDVMYFKTEFFLSMYVLCPREMGLSR